MTNKEMFVLLGSPAKHVKAFGKGIFMTLQNNVAIKSDGQNCYVSAYKGVWHDAYQFNKQTLKAILEKVAYGYRRIEKEKEIAV